VVLGPPGNLGGKSTTINGTMGPVNVTLIFNKDGLIGGSLGTGPSVPIIIQGSVVSADTRMVALPTCGR
jgi:hypothetical protein